MYGNYHHCYNRWTPIMICTIMTYVFCVRGMILSLEAAIDIEKERRKIGPLDGYTTSSGILLLVRVTAKNQKC
jgi:hypothetical protein